MISGCPRRPYWNTWIPRTEGKALLLFVHVRQLVEKLPDTPLVFVFTSGCCGGPEWAERIAFNSKPIRMHFCCTPHPLPFPHLVASPVRMMSLTAVNTVSMETPSTALAYISGSSPSILQHPPPHIPHSASPPYHPAFSPLVWWEQKRGGWRVGVGGSLLWTGRTSWSERQKQLWKIIPAPDWAAEVGWGGPLRFRCAQLLILEAESSELVPQVSSLSSIGIYMNICIYSCCVVGREQQQLTCSQRAVSMFLIIIII